MHAHEKALRDADQAMLAGDIEKFLGYHTDDVVVHVGGENSLAGTYKGKDQFGELFGRFMERAGEYTFETHSYLADDEHGVMLQRSHYRRDGDVLDTDDVFVCHFRDGKVSEMWLVTGDQAALDRFIG